MTSLQLTPRLTGESTSVSRTGTPLDTTREDTYARQTPDTKETALRKLGTVLEAIERRVQRRIADSVE